MPKAQLVSIKFDLETFIFVAMGQAFEPEVNHALWEIEEPFPKIFDLPAGDYSLHFSIPRPDKKAALSISLVNEEGRAVKFKHLSLTPMFSGFTDGIELWRLEVPAITENMDEEEALSAMFASNQSNDAANLQLKEQSALFEEMLAEFADFGEDHVALIGDLYGLIVGDASPLIAVDRSAQFAGNFMPDNPKRH